MRAGVRALNADAVPLWDKVAFLSKPDAFCHPVDDIVRRETHMSWVFLAGESVYKLKKPVRFPYLDFSTLARREAACRAELALNRRLAPDVYKAVVPLVKSSQGLAISGPGEIIDWLVVMHRLDEGQTLEHVLSSRRLSSSQLDRLVATLAAFYRRASVVFVSPAMHLSNWRLNLAYNKRVLLDTRLGLPAGLVRQVVRAQQQFLTKRAELIADRIRGRHIVDGHGDLRPEHIWLGDPIRIIDCLEFNPGLRAVDPFDEIAYLCVECERLGSAWASEYIKRRTLRALQHSVFDELFVFYRSYRATLRARLAIAHLLEPDPRTPNKWPRLAQAYLKLATHDAFRLEHLLRTPANR